MKHTIDKILHTKFHIKWVFATLSGLGIVDIDMKNFIIKSIVVFVLVTAFYFVASPYHNCLMDSDISHTECLKHTGW